MIMSNILSSCLDLRYPKPDPEPGLLTITRPKPDPKSKSAIRQALSITHHVISNYCETQSSFFNGSTDTFAINWTPSWNPLQSLRWYSLAQFAFLVLRAPQIVFWNIWTVSKKNLYLRLEQLKNCFKLIRFSCAKCISSFVSLQCCNDKLVLWKYQSFNHFFIALIVDRCIIVYLQKDHFKLILEREICTRRKANFHSYIQWSLFPRHLWKLAMRCGIGTVW